MTGFDEWLADMKRLLDQEGVVYKGQSRGTKKHTTLTSYLSSLDRTWYDGSRTYHPLLFYSTYAEVVEFDGGLRLKLNGSASLVERNPMSHYDKISMEV